LSQRCRLHRFHFIHHHLWCHRSWWLCRLDHSCRFSAFDCLCLVIPNNSYVRWWSHSRERPECLRHISCYYHHRLGFGRNHWRRLHHRRNQHCCYSRKWCREKPPYCLCPCFLFSLSLRYTDAIQPFIVQAIIRLLAYLPL
jgi:hypothetical protein